MACEVSHTVGEPDDAAVRFSPRWTGRWGSATASVILAIAAAAALLSYAYYAVFRNMQCYDDEGYMLIQIWHFFRDRPLYDDIVTFYGPMYFLSARLGFSFLSFGHDGVRLLTVASLGVSAALCGLCVLGLTRRPLLAVIGGLLTGLKLVHPFANEPGHPQIVIAVLVAAIAAVLAWWDPRRPAVMAAVVGSLVGALGMTKINIGAFAALSTFLAILLASGKPGRPAKLLRNGLILAMTLLPLALIGSRLRSRMELYQTLLYIAPVVAVLLTALTRPFPNPSPRKQLLPTACYIIAGIAVSVALGMFALAHGTTAYGLLSGIVLMPSRMIGVSGNGPWIPRAVRGETVASLALAFIYSYMFRRGLPIPPVATAALKTLFAASVLGPVFGIGLGELLNGWGLFLWVFLVRLPASDVEAERETNAGGVDVPRVSLALLAVLQPLQSYPVAGSQVSLGTMLMVPAAVTCLSDVRDWLRRRAVATAMPRGLDPLATVMVVAMVAVWASHERSAYVRSVPLGLPGSSRLRLPERQVAGIRWLVANIDHSCSTFLCTTGFHSLYLWAEKEPTSCLTLGNEVELFKSAQQKALLNSIEATPRPLIIDHASHFTPSNQKSVAPGHERVLLDGIERDFVAYGGGTVEGYTLKARRGYPLPEIVECAHWGGDGPVLSATLDLLPKPGHVADRICIVEVGGKTIGGLKYTEVPDRILADSRDGAPAAALELLEESGERSILPLDLAIPRRLTLRLPPGGGRSPELLTVVRLIDRDGQLITSVPFVTPFGPKTVAAANMESK